METIEVDARVPGNRDEFPSPQPSSALQELDSPSCQFKCPFSPKLTVLQEKRIVTIPASARICTFLLPKQTGQSEKLRTKQPSTLTF